MPKSVSLRIKKRQNARHNKARISAESIPNQTYRPRPLQGEFGYMIYLAEN